MENEILKDKLRQEWESDQRVQYCVDTGGHFEGEFLGCEDDGTPIFICSECGVEFAGKNIN